MQFVILTALGVGGATMLGAVLGFWLQPLLSRFETVVLGFGGGVMLGSTVWGLVVPALSYGGKHAVFITVLGVFLGAAALIVLPRYLPRPPITASKSVPRVWLLVPAIALHNLPEGIAAGVGFASQNMGAALFIAGGIALQNLPEGMVIIAPLLVGGASRRKTLWIACLTGALEVVGVLIGYASARACLLLLPLSLAFAGGCMLLAFAGYLRIFLTISRDAAAPESPAEDSAPL